MFTFVRSGAAVCAVALALAPQRALPQPLPAPLKVTVVSGDLGLPGALVILMPAHSGPLERLPHSFTNTKGIAQFGGIAPGTYFAIGYLAGFDPARAELTVATGQPTAVVLPLLLCTGHPCPSPYQTMEPVAAPAPSPSARR